MSRLRELDPGDGVAFYAGLRDPSTDAVHRYPIGWFEVASITVVPGDAPPERERDLLSGHPENAHAKRIAVRDTPHHTGSDTVIADGRRGGLLERTGPRMSVRRDGGYRLDDAFAERFAVEEAAHGPDDPLSLQFKPAIRCALSIDAFVERVTPG